MAVQKSRKSRSKRGMRRSHDSVQASTLAIDPTTGETHRRHHVAPSGMYRGQQRIESPEAVEDEE